jgi:hypothetical protein
MTTILDARHKALLNLFFFQADEHDRLGMRRAMLEAALNVQGDYVKRTLAQLPVSMTTHAEVKGAMKLQNEKLINLICS